MLTYSSTKLCIKSLRTLVTPSVATEKLTTASTHWVNLTRAHFTMKRHHKTWWNSKLDCFEKLLAMNKFLSWFVDILRKWFRAKMTQCVNGRWTVQPMDRSIQINEETLVSCSLNWDYFHPHDEFACLRISSKSIISRYENNQVLRAALADCFSFSRQSSFMCNFSTANWRKWNLVIHQLVRTKNEMKGQGRDWILDRNLFQKKLWHKFINRMRESGVTLNEMRKSIGETRNLENVALVETTIGNRQFQRRKLHQKNETR